MSAHLADIVARPNRGHHGTSGEGNIIVCADGFTVSVLTGGGCYCSPRPTLCLAGTRLARCPEPPGITSSVACDYPGPFTTAEVGFPSAQPEPWSEWSQYADRWMWPAEDDEDPTRIVYSYVPVELIAALVESHGGEA